MAQELNDQQVAEIITHQVTSRGVHFSTTPLANGDIALVMRANGGVDILTNLDDPSNVDQDGLALRGLLTLALTELLTQVPFMTPAIRAAQKRLEGMQTFQAIKRGGH